MLHQRRRPARAFLFALSLAFIAAPLPYIAPSARAQSCMVCSVMTSIPCSDNADCFFMSAGTCTTTADADSDGVCDPDDNCPVEFNPDQLNSDCPTPGFFPASCAGSVPPNKAGCCDGGDVCDVCPADNDNTNINTACNPARSGGISIGPLGGSLVTADGCVSVDVPAGALPAHTSISVTERVGGPPAFHLGASQLIYKLAMRPSGQVFDPAVAISFCWDDRNGNGIVDRGTCVPSGFSDYGLPCDGNGGCLSGNCSLGSTVQEVNLQLQRNAADFSERGFNPGASPFKCSDHLLGTSTCNTAASVCPGTAGEGKSSVANCCTPAAYPAHGTWQFHTCHFSDMTMGEAEAGLVPGKGSQKTDCVAEWAVNNAANDPFLDNKGLPTFKQTCSDGDVECDADGAADGKCTFAIGVCMNLEDERLAKRGIVQCAPSDVASWQIKRPRPDSGKPTEAASAVALRDAVLALDPGGTGSVGGTHADVVTFSTPFIAREECTLLAHVEVPLGGPALDEKGKQTLKTVATPSPPGKRDTDTLKLTCLPPAP